MKNTVKTKVLRIEDLDDRLHVYTKITDKKYRGTGILEQIRLYLLPVQYQLSFSLN